MDALLLDGHVPIEDAAADETAADDGAIDETTAADETAAEVVAGLRAMVDFLPAGVATAAALDVSPIRAESRAAIVAGGGDGSEGSKSGDVQCRVKWAGERAESRRDETESDETRD
jgi:hypothetical protein